jgi:hypothetical protein
MTSLYAPAAHGEHDAVGPLYPGLHPHSRAQATFGIALTATSTMMMGATVPFGWHITALASVDAAGQSLQVSLPTTVFTFPGGHSWQGLSMLTPSRVYPTLHLQYVLPVALFSEFAGHAWH